MNNFEHNNTPIPNIVGVGTPPYVAESTSDVGIAMPTYFNLTETVFSRLTFHFQKSHLHWLRF